MYSPSYEPSGNTNRPRYLSPLAAVGGGLGDAAAAGEGSFGIFLLHKKDLACSNREARMEADKANKATV